MKTADQRKAPGASAKIRRLSFIVPTLDDANGLQGLYEGIRRQAEKVAEDWEVLFVDRGSGETTREVLATLAARDPGHVRSDCGEGLRGYSDALARGYREARGDYVLTVEPEQDDDPAEIPGFFARIRSAECTTANGDGDRWKKILPRGVLRRMRKAQFVLRASAPDMRLQAV